VFFAIACVFRAIGPVFYGALIGTGSSRPACSGGTWSAPASCWPTAWSRWSWASTPQANLSRHPLAAPFLPHSGKIYLRLLGFALRHAELSIRELWAH
jgi:hypothetical protein